MSGSDPVLSLEDVTIHFRSNSLLEQLVSRGIKRHFSWEDADTTVHSVDDVSL